MDPIRKKRILLAGGLGLVVVLAVIGLATRRNPAPAAPASSEPGAPPESSSGGASGATSAQADSPAPVVYDPTKLLESDVPAGEVYDKEPRSDGWADATEGFVGDAMRRDLAAMVPGAAVVLKCRTLSCLVGIDAPEDKRPSALAVTKFLMLAPWVVDLPPEEDGTLRWLFFQDPRFGDPKVFGDWYQGARKRKLADIRSGKAPNPFPVAAGDVPTE
jgi:hypothetical protein